MAKSRLCSIEGCERPAKARSWCEPHYERWRRYDDPLAGRTGKGEAERYFREVVLAYEGDECLTWPYWKDEHGYGRVGDQPVSRLACEAVNGPAPTSKHEAAHSCGKGHLACCTKRHLSWKTKAENAADRLIHGTSNRGERSGRAKLTEGDVREIRMLRGRLFQRDIAKRFGVSTTCVGMIQRRESWAWMVEPRNHKAEYMEALDAVRGALAGDAGPR